MGELQSSAITVTWYYGSLLTPPSSSSSDGPSQRMCLSTLLSPAHISRVRPNIDTVQECPLAVGTSPNL